MHSVANMDVASGVSRILKYGFWRLNGQGNAASLPLTSAMFSPRPTLFFTLLTNLRDRDAVGWGSAAAELVFAYKATDCKRPSTNQKTSQTDLKKINK